MTRTCLDCPIEFVIGKGQSRKVRCDACAVAHNNETQPCVRCGASRCLAKTSNRNPLCIGCSNKLAGVRVAMRLKKPPTDTPDEYEFTWAQWWPVAGRAR